MARFGISREASQPGVIPRRRSACRVIASPPACRGSLLSRASGPSVAPVRRGRPPGDSASPATPRVAPPFRSIPATYPRRPRQAAAARTIPTVPCPSARLSNIPPTLMRTHVGFPPVERFPCQTHHPHFPDDFGMPGLAAASFAAEPPPGSVPVEQPTRAPAYPRHSTVRSQRSLRWQRVSSRSCDHPLPPSAFRSLRSPFAT